MVKFNKNSVTLSYDEFFALKDVAASLISSLVIKDDDEYSCYFNDESLIAVSKDDYNTIINLLK